MANTLIPPSAKSDCFAIEMMGDKINPELCANCPANARGYGSPRLIPPGVYTSIGCWPAEEGGTKHATDEELRFPNPLKDAVARLYVMRIDGVAHQTNFFVEEGHGFTPCGFGFSVVET